MGIVNQSIISVGVLWNQACGVAGSCTRIEDRVVQVVYRVACKERVLRAEAVGRRLPDLKVDGTMTHRPVAVRDDPTCGRLKLVE